MPWYLGGLSTFAGLLFFIGIGMPISFSFALTGIIGIFLLEGPRVLYIVPQIVHDTGVEFVLVTIPLFIFMAEVLYSAGFTQALYKAFDRWIGRLPGGLALATVGSCGAFAAVCGSSYVTATTIGRIALPELVARRYDGRLATGVIAAGGTIGILIPPSLAFILYGFMSDTSIGQLFFAGVVPGLIMILFFGASVIVQAKVFGHATVTAKAASLREKLEALVTVIPVAIVAILVLGSIYLGIATPSEAAAVGCAVSIVGSLIYRRLSWTAFLESLSRTVVTTGFITLLLASAKIFAFLLALMNVSDELSRLAEMAGQPYLVLAVTLVILAILGMFMDGMAILVLAVPVFVPMLQTVGFDAIWFGVIFVIFVELCLITPPVGMNCYIVADISREYGIPLSDVFAGIVPFAFMMMTTVAVVIAFPEVALWLPGTLVR